jgi:predicted transglutaminase-like cysteine proteinase
VKPVILACVLHFFLIPQPELKPIYSEGWQGYGLHSVAAVNQFVNLFHYHKTHSHWPTAKEFLRKGGDCRGYAITKRKLLIDNHLASPVDLHLLLVQLRVSKEYHMILVDNGQVLDNIRKDVYSLNSKYFKDHYKIIGEEI